MKKIVFSLVLFLSAISGFSQVDEPTFTFGVNSGIDHNFNAYQLAGFNRQSVKYNYYGINNQYNVGIDFGVILNKKMRLRAEIKYVNTSFGVKFDTTVNHTFYKTIWNVNNFDLNVHFDYLLATYKKLEVFVSPGIKYEYYTGEYIQNTLLSIDENDTYHRLIESVNPNRYDEIKVAYPTNILGGSLEMIFKYNITKHIGITLIPEYTIFARPYVKPNHNVYSRFSTNAGFEFKF